MSKDATTSFAFMQRDVLPGVRDKLEEQAGQSRTAFEAAWTGGMPAQARPVPLSPAASSPPEPHLVLPDPRPSFAGPKSAPLPGTVVPDRSVTMAPEEMKAAFVKARLGQYAAKVSRNRGR